MQKIILQSPAKVNLYLRIVGRRPDGYHKLDTLFHRLSLADTLTLTKKDSDFSFSSNAKLPAREGNLLFKAYVELQKSFPNLGGVHAKLVKRIPIGAGMGGGSSNAAFFLLGMVQLYGLKISQARLMKIGVRVGADVPFFLLQKNQARALGIGEKLRAMPSKKKKWFLLVTDPKPLSTPAVYKKYRDQNFGFSKKSVDLNESLNDLQPAALALRPSIQRTVNVLKKSGAGTVLLSGSGPTVFAVSDSQEKIKSLCKSLAVPLRKRAILCHSL